ncbi:oligomeric, coiled-coil, peripheral membrane protein, partial [Rhizopus stolonifer]
MQHLSLSKRGLGSSNEPDEQFLDLLKNMIQDMNSMKTDFLVYLKTNFTDMETVKQDPSKVQRSLSPPLLRPTVVEESQKPSLASSPASSIFSVIEDDKKLVLENKDLKSKLTTAEEEVVSLEQKNQEQADEISQLKETIKLLENERDEFESHRKSFLNELKNKDKTADFRIASVEEDFNAKLNDLQYELEEERRMKKNLEIEHQSEMKTLQTELEAHTKTLEEIQAIHRSESEGHTRTIRQLQQDMEKHSQLKEEHTELQRRFDQLCQDMDTAIQQQTRVMVKRAQDDWESKNEELQNIKRDHDSLCQTVRSLLKRFMPQGVDQELNQASLQSYLGGFKEQLEVFEREYDVAKEDLYITMQQLSDLVRDYTNLVEVHNEWKVIASRMAEKLEDFRKNMIFEIVNQLQLPMDEEELNILQKKLTPNEDDTAVWNQILQLTSSINTQKFVLKVHKRVKDNYEQAKQYKKEYRSIKEKYNRLCTSYCEKIAFRNFQTGDIALFLPTRNASGKPWAAFNINAPHYFLKSTDNMASQMQSRDWIVARIVSITEYTANAQHPESNPYGLADGIKYYFIEAENWRHSKQHSKKRQLVQDNGLASVMIPPDDPYQQQKRPSLGPSSSSSFVHSYSS